MSPCGNRAVAVEKIKAWEGTIAMNACIAKNGIAKNSSANHRVAKHRAVMTIARVSVGALGPVIDDLNVFNLPYVFRNTTHMQHVIDGPIGQELLDKVTNSGKGLVGLAWMDAGARNFYNTKKPIKTMADLKGMK